MKIEDCVPETLNCQMSLAITESQNKRLLFIVEEFQKLPKKPNPRQGIRKKFEEFLNEAEQMIKDYKSKNLDFTGIR